MRTLQAISRKILSLTAAVAVSVPAVVVLSSAVSAEERSRYLDQRRQDRIERRYERSERRAKVSRRYQRDNSYAARARDLDPAGDYKGYPDWARVALSPKYYRGHR